MFSYHLAVLIEAHQRDAALEHVCQMLLLAAHEFRPRWWTSGNLRVAVIKIRQSVLLFKLGCCRGTRVSRSVRRGCRCPAMSHSGSGSRPWLASSRATAYRDKLT